VQFFKRFFSPGAPPAARESIAILAVTLPEAEVEVLRQIAPAAGWELLIASSFHEASEILASRAAPIILCDRDVPGFDWREVLSRLVERPERGCVILASGVVDDYLIAEVVQQGGFDVLAKPFREQDVVRTVAFAWSHYRSTK